MPAEIPGQQLHPLESAEALALLREYEAGFPGMPQEIYRFGDEMKKMRDAGIPNASAYESMRAHVVGMLEHANDLQHRLNVLAGGENIVPPTIGPGGYSQEAAKETPHNASPGVAREAERIRREHIAELEEIEDAFQRVFAEDAAWFQAREAAGQFGRRKEDYSAAQGERTLPVELYEQEVRKILYEVGMLEWAFEFSRETKRTRDSLESFHEGLTAAYERLSELDEKTPEHEESRERRSLIMLIRQLKERYPLGMQLDDAERLQAAFQAHKKVRAEYAAISHRLPEERRRYYRSRIAQLSSLVDTAAEHAWRTVATQALPSTPRPAPRPAIDDPNNRMRVLLAMTRASLAARPIADSVLGVKRDQKGIFGFLSGAFRLK